AAAGQAARPYALAGVARLGCPESHGPRNVSRANVYDDLPLPGAITLHQGDALPGTEEEPPTADRNRLGGPEDGGLEVGGAIVVDLVVLPHARRAEPVHRPHD